MKLVTCRRKNGSPLGWILQFSAKLDDGHDCEIWILFGCCARSALYWIGDPCFQSVHGCANELAPCIVDHGGSILRLRDIDWQWSERQ